MNTWKVILATLVIFGAGVITGGLLVTYSESVLQRPRRAANADSARHPTPTNAVRSSENRGANPFNFQLRRDKEFLDRLDRELKLSREQRERIARLIGEGQQRIREISKRIDPQIRAEVQETRERIRAELSAEQQTFYSELLRHHPILPRPATNPPPSLTATNSPPE